MALWFGWRLGVALDLAIVEFEIGRVEDIDERHVEHAQIDRGIVRTIAVIMPGVVRVSTRSPGPNVMFSPSTPVNWWRR